MDFTPIVRRRFVNRARRTDAWADRGEQVQLAQLRRLLQEARDTDMGRKYAYVELLRMPPRQALEHYRQRVPLIEYEDIRVDIGRMISGEKDVLWPGRCRWYAQSSGTSGGKSKYIPITDASLQLNHYRGAEDCVSFYLRAVPDSRIFSGKGMILGGSFANELGDTLPRGVHVGDLSATLIERITPLANLMRVPSKKVALMSDWSKKLPALARAALRSNVTNISGVPSWWLSVIKEILRISGKETLADVWPHLEVFFHGGISFEPYRADYDLLTRGCPIRFMETYNASEGFFAAADRPDDPSMLLLLDLGVFFEFIDIATPSAEPVDLSGIKKGHSYELVISAPNGLWRYRPGDTIHVESLAPPRITMAGRTRSFINAFGEELMEWNADRALAAVCRLTGASVKDYTVGPVYATATSRGRHEWIIEWERRPESVEEFADLLDRELQSLNSDYQAKRTGGLFIDRLSIVDARPGLFETWLASTGSHKLGGQRKVPRLSNDRSILDALLPLIRS